MVVAVALTVILGRRLTGSGWAGLFAGLPARYRYLLPVADPVLGRGVTLCLFAAGQQV